MKLTFGAMPAGVSTGTTNETVVSITDDDPTVNVRFDDSAYTVAIGGTQDVKFILNADPERTITFPLTKADQNGATCADYTAPGSVAFASGETE